MTKTESAQDVCNRKVSQDTRYEVKTRFGVGTNCQSVRPRPPPRPLGDDASSANLAHRQRRKRVANHVLHRVRSCWVLDAFERLNFHQFLRRCVAKNSCTCFRMVFLRKSVMLDHLYRLLGMIGKDGTPAGYRTFSIVRVMASSIIFA